MISISGVFAVTFSVVFAYVADVTTVENRSRAYGMVSATFAASLVRTLPNFPTTPNSPTLSR
jgi:predicted MFS family arabinose efflux permease